MRPDDEAALLDIAYSARRVSATVNTIGLAEFIDDETAQESVLYRLIILGEAVKRLSPEFRALHSAVGWQAIAGLRDILVHAYERVNLHLVWNIATVDVAALLSYIEPLLPFDDEGQDREPRSE